MRTAVDTSVLLDVFGADPSFGRRSSAALRHCLSEGSLLACEIVWAEVAAFFPSQASAREAMQRMGVEYSPSPLETALEAGKSWNEYRSRGGSRQRIVSDFLIASHALKQADRLLTRDRGFYRSYFRQLSVLDSSQSQQ